MVVGNDSDPPLQMDFVANLADVKVGDRVVTSGLDGIYPPGFAIGHVEKVQDGHGLYKHIEIRPVVDFRALQTVLVVLDPPEKPKPGEGPGDLKPAQLPPAATTQNQPAAAPPGLAARSAARPGVRRAAPARAATGHAASGGHTARRHRRPRRRHLRGDTTCRNRRRPPATPVYARPGRRSVKAAAVCLATILALAVQTTMLPFALAGRGHVDLVLVVVIYAALQFGPATGLLTGALAGMAQDALSGGVIGVGGIAKTIVGLPGRRDRLPVHRGQRRAALRGAAVRGGPARDLRPGALRGHRQAGLRGGVLADRLAPGAHDGGHRDYPDTDGPSDSGFPDAPAAAARVP